MTPASSSNGSRALSCSQDHLPPRSTTVPRRARASSPSTGRSTPLPRGCPAFTARSSLACSRTGDRRATWEGLLSRIARNVPGAGHVVGGQLFHGQGEREGALGTREKSRVPAQSQLNVHLLAAAPHVRGAFRRGASRDSKRARVTNSKAGTAKIFPVTTRGAFIPGIGPHHTGLVLGRSVGPAGVGAGGALEEHSGALAAPSQRSFRVLATSRQDRDAATVLSLCSLW